MDMTQITRFVTNHRRTLTIVGINVAGVLFIVLLIAGLNRAVAGPAPEPEHASAPQVLEYLASSGMKAQSNAFKLQYVRKALDYYTASPERMQQFEQSLDTISDAQAEQLKENIFDATKEQFMQDAQEYYTLRTPQQKRNYIDGKVRQWSAVRSMVSGRSSSLGGSSRGGGIGGGGGGGGRNVAANPKLTRNVPMDASGAVRELVSRSNPGERAKLETYLGDVQNRVQQLKAYQAQRR